jgi:predicted DNA binding CopG/RHH family protein
MEEKEVTKQVIKPVSQEEAKKAFEKIASDKNKQRIKDFNEDGYLSLLTFEGVGKFKSIRRAIRRGHVSLAGVVYPRRPFNNRKRGPGSINYERKKLYEQFRRSSE